MVRFTQIVIALIGIIALATCLLATVLLTNAEALRHSLQWAVSSLLKREFRIDEITETEFGKNTYLQMKGLQLSNPQHAPHGNFVRIETLALRFNVPSLWQEGPIVIQHLDLGEVRLNFIAEPGQTASWDFGIPAQQGQKEPAPFPLLILNGSSLNNTIHYRDEDQDILAELDAINLSQRVGDDLIYLNVTGRVNEELLRLDGTVGPAGGLFTGRDMQLSLSLDWGQTILRVEGGLGNLYDLSEPTLKLELQAPNSRSFTDFLGVPEIREGELYVSASVNSLPSAINFDAGGTLGEFKLILRGEANNLLDFSELNVGFQLTGPSMKEAGALLEVHGLPDVPYSVAADVSRIGQDLRVENGLIRAERGSLAISGHLPQFPEIDDWQVDVEGSNLNLSLIASSLGIKEIREQLYGVKGGLSSNDLGVELLDLMLTGETGSLTLTGIIGEAPDFHGTQLKLLLAGDNLAETGPWLGLSALPPESFELSGEANLDANGWRLREGRLEAASLNVGLAGSMDRLLDTTLVDADFTVSSRDINRTLAAYGVEVGGVPAIPLRVEGNMAGDLNKITFSKTNLRSGGVAGTVTGSLENPQRPSGLELQFQLQGPDVNELKLSLLDFPQPSAFSLSSGLAWTPDELQLSKVQLALGNNSATGKASLGLPLSSDNYHIHADLKAAGPSTSKLFALLGYDPDLPDRPYTISAEITGDPKQLSFENLELLAGKSDLRGNFQLIKGDQPRVKADLSSQLLYVPYFLPDLKELEAEKERDSTPVEDFTRALTTAEKRERLIPDTTFSLDVLNQYNMDFSYHVDEVYFKENATFYADLDVSVEEGVLQTRKLLWNGNLTSGVADIQVDASQADYNYQLNAQGDSLPIFFLLAGEPDEANGDIYRLKLASRGKNLRAMAANLDGIMIFEGGSGRMSNYGLDLVVGDLFAELIDILNPATAKETHTLVECKSGALEINDGMISAVPGFILRTDKMDYVSGGAIDLNDESMNMAFSTRSRKGIGISASKAVTPYIKVGGTLANPRLALDARGAVISGGAAYATAGLSILAEGLWDRWVIGARDACGELIKRALRDKNRGYRELVAEPPLEGARIEATPAQP